MDFQKTKFQKATVLLFIWAIAGGAMGAAYQGFTLFGPNNGRYTYLINMNNAVVLNGIIPAAVVIQPIY
jgi:hypothetical protein